MAQLLAFDEDDKHHGANQVFSLLLGDAVPESQRNPTSQHSKAQKARYNHYSTLATVERNWNLGNLGQHDKGATVFPLDWH